VVGSKMPRIKSNLLTSLAFVPSSRGLTKNN
jgi:hypothetical protein